MPKINKHELMNVEEDKDVKPYFDLINKLDDDDQIKDHRCKFCNHELRPEAEKAWEMTKQFKPVLEYFVKNGCTTMTMKNIRCHIRNHYLRQEQLILRRHYAERLLPVINYKINKLKRVQMFLTILEDKLWKYASIEHENTMYQLRCDDMLLKIVKEASSLIKIQAEIEGDLKPIQVVIDKFQQIIVSAMSKIDDPGVKMQMTKELEGLKEVGIIDVEAM